jgi:hypothetical protein
MRAKLAVCVVSKRQAIERPGKSGIQSQTRSTRSAGVRLKVRSLLPEFSGVRDWLAREVSAAVTAQRVFAGLNNLENGTGIVDRASPRAATDVLQRRPDARVVGQ